jgi:hypothetical protein
MDEINQNLGSEMVSSGALLLQPKYIAKKSEYRLLIKLIKSHKLAISTGRGYNIQAVVKTLNVDPKTARRWLETPKVQQAIVEELEFYIQKMQEVGKDDWRMWAKQVEMAQGLIEDKAIKNQNQINVQIITKNEDGSQCFRVEESLG